MILKFKVFLFSCVAYWVSPGFGRFGNWQAGILATGQFGVKMTRQQLGRVES